MARGIRGTGQREIWSRVGGVPGGHFERIYRLFGGRAPLGHSQGWLVCHITNPRSVVSLPVSRVEKRSGVFSRDSSIVWTRHWTCAFEMHPKWFATSEQTRNEINGQISGSRMSEFIKN